MSAGTILPSKLIKKQVLQQSNCNTDNSYDKNEDPKLLLEKSAFVINNKDDMSFENENQCIALKKSDQNVKSDAKKLRNIRLDLSSLKRGVIQRANCTLKSENDFSSEESSDEELKNNRKVRPIVPNYVTNTDRGPCRKPRQSRQDPMLLSSQTSPKVAKTQPLSIARRNARERNRVKQVNEGFASLRSRIPEYISEAYNEEKGRKSAKKLSKVETLRMAVDYIRHLETLLDLKSTDAWMKQISTDSQPWDTPSSSEYPSPVESKYQPSSIDSPGPSYDQGFEYQDRIFYDYDLDFIHRKEGLPDKRTFAVLPLNGTESESVEDFKYYETFNKLKKENTEETVEGDHRENLENVEVTEQEPEMHLLPKSSDLMKKVVVLKDTVLPSITESFNKGVPVFF